MKAIKTKTTNRVYTGEGYQPLPATVIQFSDGKLVTETCFELNETELEQVRKSKRIYLTFVGQTIIPFMLHTKSNAEPTIEPAVQDEGKSSRWVQDVNKTS